MTGKVHSTRLYIGIAAALLILLGLTIVCSMIDLGALNLPVALSIAVVKALLVVVFFMHIGTERGTPRIVALTGVLWLMIMFSLMFADFLSRS